MLVPNQRGKKQADRVCNGVAIVGASASVRIGIATSADPKPAVVWTIPPRASATKTICFIHAICSVLRLHAQRVLARVHEPRQQRIHGQGTLCCSPKRLMAPFNASISVRRVWTKSRACSHSARQSVYQFLERSVLCRPPACPSRGTRIAAATAYNSSTISRIVWRVCSVSSRPP